MTSAHSHFDHCECDGHSHAVSHSTSSVSGLVNLPDLTAGNCGCDACGPELPERKPVPIDDHDHESCSICRMILEHAVEVDTFTVSESVEPAFDLVVFSAQLPKLSIVSAYLTRGPPAIDS